MGCRGRDLATKLWSYVKTWEQKSSSPLDTVVIIITIIVSSPHVSQRFRRAVFEAASKPYSSWRKIANPKLSDEMWLKVSSEKKYLSCRHLIIANDFLIS